MIFAVKNSTRCYSGVTLQSWRTTNHFCQYSAQRKVFRYIQPVDCNDRQSFYWDMISAYRKTEFGQTDIISQLIRAQSVSDVDTVIAAISIEDDCQRTLTDCIRTIPVTRMEIKQETQQDPMIQKVCGFLRHSWPPNLTGDLQQFKRRSGSLSVIDGCLIFADRVVVLT